MSDKEQKAKKTDEYRAGWNAALRSLGVGTPEAEAALRALVEASREVGVTDACACSIQGPCAYHADGFPRLAYEFGQLAIPDWM